MLRYHKERVSVGSQHRRHQDASQVKIVAKTYKLGGHIYIYILCRLHIFEITYLPCLETLLCLVV